MGYLATGVIVAVAILILIAVVHVQHCARCAPRPSYRLPLAPAGKRMAEPRGRSSCALQHGDEHAVADRDRFGQLPR